MNENLIIDAGMHKCEDTTYYLKKGFKVVSIDADINLVNRAKANFKEYVNKGTLTLLNYALSSEDDEEITFNISKETLWNSINAEISDRRGNLGEQVSVKTQKLSSLFKKYGVPYYCKIDLEGHDNIALKTLFGTERLPKFISVETECLGEGQVITEKEALETLDTLFELGYNKFKLVDQRTLEVLTDIRGTFYKDQPETYFGKKLDYLSNKLNQLSKYDFKLNHRFPVGSSGSFGEDLKGSWVNYEQAKHSILIHRAAYFRTKMPLSFGFWCDWHAMND